MPLGLSGSGLITGFDPTASGFGKVLQVVRATDTVSRNTNSATFVDASISVTVTPKKSDSIVILIWSFSTYNGGSTSSGSFQITDSSNNAVSGAERLQFQPNVVDFVLSFTLIGQATPATTSPTTYKGRFRRDGGSGLFTIQNNVQTGQLFAIEVAA